MPTAWELLTGNSTLQTGTAWEHLNAQKQGQIIIGEGDFVTEIQTIEGVTELLTDEVAEITTLDGVTETIIEATHGDI